MDTQHRGQGGRGDADRVHANHHALVRYATPLMQGSGREEGQGGRRLCEISKFLLGMPTSTQGYPPPPPSHSTDGMKPFFSGLRLKAHTLLYSKRITHAHGSLTDSAYNPPSVQEHGMSAHLFLVDLLAIDCPHAAVIAGLHVPPDDGVSATPPVLMQLYLNVTTVLPVLDEFSDLRSEGA